MSETRFADGFDVPESVAFGLAPAQLGIVVLGTLGIDALLRSGGPRLLVVPAACLLLALTAALGWLRLAGRPALEWLLLAVSFGWRPRSGAITVTLKGAGGGESTASRGPAASAPGVRGDDGPHPGDLGGDGGIGAGALTAEIAARSVETSRAAARGLSAGGPVAAGGPSRGADAVAPWARWLDDDHPGIAAVRPVAPTDPAPKPASVPARPAGEALEAAGPSGSEVEAPRRIPLVLLPQPVAHPRRAEVDRDSQGDPALPEEPDPEPHPGPAVLPLPASPAAEPPLVHDPVLRDEAAGLGRGGDVAPVFVGATRRIVLFSLNGGAGRTMLATELGCLLAARGQYREPGDGSLHRLRVALLDLDLRSPTVSVRLGIPQPTIWDYALSGKADPTTLDRYVVRHESGLRVVLGPPKPSSAGTSPIDPDLVAGIVRRFESEGMHFILMDVSADLGAVGRWALAAAHDIFVVLTPTASGIQDAYRSTEALRRLDLRHKLAYVVNRTRGHVDLSDTMADLGGRIVAEIPYDLRIEAAENLHRSAALDGHGPAALALARLAASIYPGLAPPHRRSLVPRRWRRRQA